MSYHSNLAFESMTGGDNSPPAPLAPKSEIEAALDGVPKGIARKLRTLSNAIANGKQVYITYTNAKELPSARYIIPSHIYETKDGNFVVVAMDSKRKTDRTFRVDRMGKCRQEVPVPWEKILKDEPGTTLLFAGSPRTRFYPPRRVKDSAVDYLTSEYGWVTAPNPTPIRLVSDAEAS